MPTKTVKKTPAKKPAKKVVKPVAAPKPVAAEIPAPVHYCQCTRRKKIFILTCTFIAGFLVSQLFCFCGCPHHKRMPRPHFVNGCMDVASVKCPKLLENLPNIDANGDGCITRAELRASKKHAKHHHEKPAPVEEPTVNVEEAIAPVAE